MQVFGLWFNFVDFSTGTNKVFCVNFATDITWEVGNVKFKCIKIYILPFTMQGCCYVRYCGDVVKCIYAKSELLQKAWTQMRRYTTGSHIQRSR